jgi:hypothetical protein
MRGGGGAVAVEPDSGCGVVRARPAVAVATPQVLEHCTLHIYMYTFTYLMSTKKNVIKYVKRRINFPTFCVCHFSFKNI